MNQRRTPFRANQARSSNAAKRLLLIALLSSALAGCSTLGSSGPNTGAVRKADAHQVNGADIRVIDLSNEVARDLITNSPGERFSDVFGDGPIVGTIIGPGDVLDVTIWESPPAALFGMLGGTAVLFDPTAIDTAKKTDMPQQMVYANGMFSLPFVGTLRAAGRSPLQLQADIAARLKGIANHPQVSVGIERNATSNVTVIGKVTTSGRIPLTPRGERLLDVLATAGGVVDKLEKTTIQVTRGSKAASMPMETLIRDPQQNIRLQADDVVTAIYQPYSFTALGAVGTSSEIEFEATGISLSQALGRVGGLQDNRANVKGVFVFRFEDPRRLDPAIVANAELTPDGKLPVIYRVNLGDPRSLFLAQSFAMRDHDVLYVSNAPGVDLQKFVNILTQTAYSVINISRSITGN